MGIVSYGFLFVCRIFIAWRSASYFAASLGEGLFYAIELPHLPAWFGGVI